MKRLLSSVLTVALVAALGGGAVSAKTCRDAHGKFMKCPAAMGSMMMSGHGKKCRDAKGKFTKCHDDAMMHKKM